jgi:hypothetical protein
MAPLCIYCGIATVTRAFGTCNPGLLGPRIMHGVRWRWFCGTSCSAKHRMDGAPRERMQHVAAANMRAAQRRTLNRIVAATKGAMKPAADFPADAAVVDPKDLVRAMMHELRGQYQRQYHHRRQSQGGSEAVVNAV